MAPVDSERNPLEVLAEEFAERQRRGEHPSLSEYGRRYPDLAEEIEELFPTIVAMEQLKQRKLESGSGRASLGGAQLQWLGDYHIIREIGRGGMGIVYEAEQQSLGRRVAIKVLPRQATLESKQLMRFQREAQTAARLHHTNIVPVYGVGQQDGFHYYAMQYIRGLGLDLVLAELRNLELVSEQAGSGSPPPDSEGMSAAEAALAMLDGRFSVPRKPGSVPTNSDPVFRDATLGETDLLPSSPAAAASPGAASPDAGSDPRLPDAPRADAAAPGLETASPSPDRSRGSDETEDREAMFGILQPAPPDGDDTPLAPLSATPPPRAEWPLASVGDPLPGVAERAGESAAGNREPTDDGPLQHEPLQHAGGQADAVCQDAAREWDRDGEHDGEAGQGGAATHRVTGSRVRGRRYWRSVARTGLQVADALHYAHSQGTLHRDIKPGNLLLDAQGAVWVTDFGLARALEDDRVTRTGDIVGTLRYMAPEQINGEADARSDIYSLGLTLYELLTLQPAFEASNRNQLVQQVTLGAPPRPRSICPEVPRDLETIVLKAIAREPSHRYQTAEQLCEDLHRFLEDRSILARRPSPPERLWRWCRRNRAVAALMITAFAAVLLAAVVGWVGYVRTSRQHAQAQAATALAEDNLDLALRAFEDIFNRISGQSAFQPMEAAEEEAWEEPPPEHVISTEDAALLQRMLAFYDQFADRNQGNVKLSRETARANRRVGDIQRRLGNYAASEDAYRKALDTYAALAEDQNQTTAYALERAAIKNDLAGVYAKRRQFSSAAQQIRDAERLLLALPAELAGRPAARMELVRTYNQMVQMRVRVPGMSRGEMRSRGEETLKILEGLREEDPDNPDYRLATAQTMLQLAGSRWFWDRSRTESDPTDEAIAMLKQLVADYPDNPTYRFALAETYAHTALRRSMFREPELAMERLETAIEILTRLTADFDHIPDYRSSLVRAHMRLAMHLQMLAQVGRSRGGADQTTTDQREGAALSHLETAVALQSALASEYPTVPSYRITLDWSSLMLAKYLIRHDSFEDARPLLDDLLGTNERRLRQSTEEDQSSGSFTLALQADALEILSKIQEHAGQTELAGQSMEQARQIREQLAGRDRGEGDGRDDDRGRSRRSPGRSRFAFPPPQGPRGGRSQPDGPRRGPPGGPGRRPVAPPEPSL